MRIKLFSILLFISGWAFSLPGRDTINLYRYDELVFHSDFEQASLECINNEGVCDYFTIAMATDAAVGAAETEKYRWDFYRFLEGLKADRKFTRNPKTQVNHIFNSIHDRYFRLYQDNPLFSEIFLNGNFNCLTASALFAMAFEYYEIPYQIILQPDHVHLLAYTQELSIVVETTNPLKGARVTISNKEKVESVQSLLDLKIVSQEEVNQKGVDQVFNETYFSSEAPDLRQLMGALYFNLAAQETQKMRFKNSYEYYKKSSVIYPRPITTAMLINHSAMFLTQNHTEDRDTYRVLSEMEKFLSYGLTHNMLAEQGMIFINSLQNAGKNHLADSAYVWLYNGFTDETIKNDLRFSFYNNKSLQSIKSYQYDEALAFIETAYVAKPEDINASYVLMELIMQKIRSTQTVAEGYDIMVNMSERVEPLNRNQKFMDFFQFVYLELFNHYIMEQNFDQAEKYRLEFEEKFQPGTITSVETIQYLEQVYSRASIVYYRDRRKILARSLLNSGLNYVPDSFELKSKLDALN